MKRRWLIGFVLFMYIASIILLPNVHFAEENSEEKSQSGGNPLGFSYRVIKPENQINPKIGYFDLKMAPGQNQVVTIEMTNDSEQPVEVTVSLNGAKTNSNGVIEYGPNTIDNDASLKYDFVDVVKAPEMVEIPAHSTIPLEIAITMPEVSYDGVISGGIQLKKKVDEEERKKQTGVINEYAFMIGMLLKETETEVQPNLDLNSVSGGMSNYRNSVLVNFSNVEAAYLEDLTMEVQVMKKGSESVLYDKKKANMRIAPNSMVEFPVPMNGEKMLPGDYRALIKATAGERTWTWDEEFAISDEQADKFNKQDVELVQEEGINWMIVGVAIGAMILVGLLLFLLIRLVRKKKNGQKKKRKKGLVP